MIDPRLLTALRWSFVIFIVLSSGQTFLGAMNGQGETHLAASGLMALSGAEALAAAALLVRPWAQAAAGVLCGVFAIAGVVTMLQGEAPLRFIYYAATAILLGFAAPKAEPAAP